MTPLAMRVAHELTLPSAKRAMVDLGGVVNLINQDLHCFDVTAIAKPVHDAMDEANVWPDVLTMLPRMFLPSPTTWLEMNIAGRRVAWVLESAGDEWFKLSLVCDDPDLYSVPVCNFRGCSILENAERIEVADTINPKLKEEYRRGESIGEMSVLHSVATKEGFVLDEHGGSLSGATAKVARLRGTLDNSVNRVAKVELDLARLTSARDILRGGDGEIPKWQNHGIAFCTLALDLINTPGLIGLRQHDPHRGLAKRLATAGSYPLQGWSEITLKHQTKLAGPCEQPTGTTFHKCLHFVRSHLRHYQSGKVTVIPAHWRGDPALGIKRTRYRLAA
jgi:hypothetical protein